jgi:hypothetical protein
VHNKADVNLKDSRNKTPLMIAVERGYLETVKFLLESGADYRVLTPEKEDLVTLAAKRNFPKIKELLEQHFASGMRKNPSATSLDTLSKKANYDGNSHSSNLGSIDVDSRQNTAPVGPPGYHRGGNTGRPIVHPPGPKHAGKQSDTHQTFTNIPPQALMGQPTHTLQDWKNRQSSNVVMDSLDAYDNTRPIDHKIEIPISAGFIPPTAGGQVTFAPPYMVPQQPYMKFPKGRGMHKDPMADQMALQMQGVMGVPGVPGAMVPHGAPRME